MQPIIFCLALLLNTFYVAQSCVSTTINVMYCDDLPINAIAIIKGQQIVNGTVYEIRGSMRLTQTDENGPVQVNISITGLPPTPGTGKHGFHIHQKGITVISDNVTVSCGSSGPHYNPTNVTHGDRTAAIRHVGDLGNINSDSNGTIAASFEDNMIKLCGINSVIGRTIVLHANEDDLGLKSDEGSKTTGNSGARIACGVIGIA